MAKFKRFLRAKAQMCKRSNGSFSMSLQPFQVFRNTCPSNTNTPDPFLNSFQPCGKFALVFGRLLDQVHNLHKSSVECAQTTSERSNRPKQLFKIKTLRFYRQKRVFRSCFTRTRTAEHQQQRLSGGGRPV